MKLLPSAGPERRRLILMIGALVIIAVAYYLWGGTPKPNYPTITGPPAASVPVARPPRAGRVTGAPSAAPAVDTSTPQPLKLAEIEQVPDEPKAGRNLFRFGVKPLPPPPPYVAPPPPPPPPPPGPPPIPPIPLRLTGIIADPYVPGRNRAYLIDKTNTTFEALEGQVVDGRYKLLKVGTTSVVMCYVDGTGQRTITQGGG